MGLVQRIRNANLWVRFAIFSGMVFIGGILFRLADWVGFLLILFSVSVAVWTIVGAFKKRSNEDGSKTSVRRGFALLGIVPVTFFALVALGFSFSEVIKPLSDQELQDRATAAAQREAEAAERAAEQAARESEEAERAAEEAAEQVARESEEAERAAEEAAKQAAEQAARESEEAERALRREEPLLWTKQWCDGRDDERESEFSGWSKFITVDDSGDVLRIEAPLSGSGDAVTDLLESGRLELSVICVTNALGTSDTLKFAINNTNAIMGLQDEEENGLAYRWFFSGNSGLSMLIQRQ